MVKGNPRSLCDMAGSTVAQKAHWSPATCFTESSPIWSQIHQTHGRVCVAWAQNGGFVFTDLLHRALQTCPRTVFWAICGYPCWLCFEGTPQGKPLSSFFFGGGSNLQKDTLVRRLVGNIKTYQRPDVFRGAASETLLSLAWHDGRLSVGVDHFGPLQGIATQKMVCPLHGGTCYPWSTLGALQQGSLKDTFCHHFETWLFPPK